MRYVISLLILILIWDKTYNVPKSVLQNEEFLVNYRGERILWEKYPISFEFDESVPKDLRSKFLSEIKDLNKTFKKEIIVLKKGSSNKIFYGQIQYPRKKERQQAITLMRFVDTKITGFNMYFFENEPGIDIPTLIRHEIGHVLGLNHINNFNNLMYKDLPKGVVRNWEGVKPLLSPVLGETVRDLASEK